MRKTILALAVATATAYAQNSELSEKLRRAVVHVQTVDKELERAQELYRNKAPIRMLQRCVIQQPYTMVVSGVSVSPREVLTVALHPRANLRILVTYHDGREAEAEIIGTDPFSNLALIRVPEETKDHLTLNEEAVHLEDSLQLVGFEIANRVTRPVTAEGSVNREQMPVRIRDIYGVTNHGLITLGSSFAVATTNGHPNVGSACVDDDGRLVGLVVGGLPTRMIADPSRPGQWSTLALRFAVPAARIARVVKDLRTHGRVIRACFGLRVQPVEPSLRAQIDLPASACAVTWVDPRGPMAKAGLEVNDVILTLDGKNYKDTHQLGEAMSEQRPGAKVPFEVLRAGKKLKLAATPAEWK